jgi:AraC-like DNA-binding protein
MFINTKDYYYLKIENNPHFIFETGRPYWCFDYYKSKVQVLDKNGEYTMCDTDTFFIIPPDIRTEIHSADESAWTHTSVTFFSDYEFMDKFKLPYMTPIKIENFKELEQLMFDMQNKAISNSQFTQELKNLYLQLIFIFVHDIVHTHKEDYKVEAGDDLQRIRHTMMNSPGVSWTVEKMANMANISVRSFQRKYKKLYGKTPIADLYDFRFTKSKRLLDTGYSISHILNSCGFKSPQHFSRFFKERAGITPSQYKAGGKKLKK